MRKLTFNKDLPKNLPLLLKKRVNEIGEFYFQAAKNKSGEFVYYTYNQVYERVIAFAKVLKNLGIKHGDNVALISDNRCEWLVADFAIQSLGAADVPRGCDSMGNEIRFIISFAECKYGFFENFKQLNKVLESIKEVPLLHTAILFDHAEKDEVKLAEDAGIKVYFFDELLEQGSNIYNANIKSVKEEIENDMELVEEDDVATIIFTSGTTGTPKGVMLTQKNYMSQLSVIHNFIPCKPGESWMTILPVWHSFERLIQYVVLLMKCYVAYSKPVAPILLPDMAAIKPQWMCGVPRLWESLYKGITRAMSKKGGITLAMFNFFIGAGKIYSHQKAKVHADICRFKFRSRTLDFIAGIIPCILLWPLHKIGDVLVYRKIREKFGGRFKMAISGGGALQKEVDDFYRAINFTLLEGYGLSETGPVISVRDYKHRRSGCVGIIFPTMEVKIVKEKHGLIENDEHLGYGKQGLVVVRGTQVMKGYYNRPDLTEKIIDKDGWLNTGDLGILTYDDEIKITGRAKDTIVLLDGENIEPAVIESALLTSEYIESAMVLGQDKKYLGCLIVPSKEAVTEFAKEEKLNTEDYDALLKNEKIDELFVKEINKAVSVENGFRTCEKIYKFSLLANSFKVGQELSAKQEMIRYKISEMYAAEIETLFAS